MGPGDPFRVTGRLGLLELVLSPPFGEELIDEGAIGSNIPPHPPKLAHERGPRGHDEPVLLDPREEFLARLGPELPAKFGRDDEATLTVDANGPALPFPAGAPVHSPMLCP